MVIVRNPGHSRIPCRHAFTLVELLVACALVGLILTFVLRIVSVASTGIRQSSDRISAFQGARDAFEMITSALSQATLESHYDYYDAARRSRQDLVRDVGAVALASFRPTLYGRYSDLHFVSGKNLLPSPWEQAGDAVFFQAPLDHTRNSGNLGLQGTLNACGFFVSFTDASRDLPLFMASRDSQTRFRFRLYQMVQPTEWLAVYGASDNAWFEAPLRQAASAEGVFPLVDNVLLLVIVPKHSEIGKPHLAADLRYDSRATWNSGSQPEQMHRLPPLMEVVLVAMDETSAERLFDQASSLSQAEAALGLHFESLFNLADHLESDIATVEKALANKHIGYRVFRQTIALRAGRTSDQPTP